MAQTKGYRGILDCTKDGEKNESVSVEDLRGLCLLQAERGRETELFQVIPG